MNYFLLLLISLNILYADKTIRCEEYTQISKDVTGKSPPLNMMIQTIKEYRFPERISKQDEAFKKLSGIESLVEKRVDLVVLWNSSGDYTKLSNRLHKVNIDSCAMDLDSIYSYVEGYRTLGKIMNRENRANELSAYIDEKLTSIEVIKESIPVQNRLSVYYARSEDGLESDCKGSSHSEVIGLVGGTNPIRCDKIKNMHMTIGLERLMSLNPDVIITANKNFFKKVFKEQKYRYLKAVKEEKVYLIPTRPINWIDNPPSFFKILGALWLGQKVYPDHYKYDLEDEKKYFFKLFLQQGGS